MTTANFIDETVKYLETSFEKVHLQPQHVGQMFEWLKNAPKWTTIRANINMTSDPHQAVTKIQDFLDKSYEDLNKRMNESQKMSETPKCSILNENLSECIVFNSSVSRSSIQKLNKIVVIDVKCAQSVLRGADIFLPGILALSMHAKANDEISVYSDASGKCLKGSDPSLFLKNNPHDSLYFVGNGWLLFDRDQVFKQDPNTAKSGVGVKMNLLTGGYYIPSLDRLDSSLFFLQNLPSMICAKVLDPKENELILDMCAAPGGKTTHIAEIVNNKSRIIAFDKISSKIVKMKELFEKLGATSIECVCQDGTKLDFTVYKPGSFDRVLVDAPCSALGQRPLIFNDITPGQLKSYIVYQKKLIENAIKLLKPGGTMVYSTCTITVEENEEQVGWILSKFSNMRLVDQNPFVYAISGGLECAGLDTSQLKLLQRFMPNFSDPSHSDRLNNNDSSIFYDTNGFFISKFVKDSD